LKKFPEQIFGVNWDAISFKLGEGPLKRLVMDEPTHGTKRHVQTVLERAQTAAELVAALGT
jgi:proteasome accessory factor A